MSENVKNEKTAERNFGIDLFRFISMLMIVAIHVLLHGGILDNAQPFTLKGEISWFLYISVYCSVNCFALISGYLGVNSKHKWKNLVALVAQALFYCFIFTAIYVCVLFAKNEPFDLSFILKSLIPALAGRYWYFSAYFCLFFFMPILDRVVDLPKPVLKRAATLVFVVFCCISQVINKVSNLSKGYSFLWLAILYVVGGYMSKHKPLKNFSFGKSILSYFSCIAITLASKMILCYFGGSGQLLIAYSSPTLALAAIFLLNAFADFKVKKKHSKIILFLSSASFGVYLIHCQPVIYDKLLSDAFAGIMDYNVFVVIAAVFVIVLSIYLICTLIDFLRKWIFRIFKIDVLIDCVSNFATTLFNFIEGKN